MNSSSHTLRNGRQKTGVDPRRTEQRKIMPQVPTPQSQHRCEALTASAFRDSDPSEELGSVVHGHHHQSVASTQVHAPKRVFHGSGLPVLTISNVNSRGRIWKGGVLLVCSTFSIRTHPRLSDS